MIKKIINWFRLRRDVRKMTEGTENNYGWHYDNGERWQEGEPKLYPDDREPYVSVTYIKTEESMGAGEGWRAESPLDYRHDEIAKVEISEETLEEIKDWLKNERPQ